jgi:hypothetical protein
MQAVARIAIIAAYRGMFVFTLEIYTVVTLDAVKSQCVAGNPRQEQDCKDNNMHKTFIHHGVLSS